MCQFLQNLKEQLEELKLNVYSADPADIEVKIAAIIDMIQTQQNEHCP